MRQALVSIQTLVRADQETLGQVRSGLRRVGQVSEANCTGTGIRSESSLGLVCLPYSPAFIMGMK
jgi:hypothetical protein